MRVVQRETVYDNGRFAVIQDCQELPDGTRGTWDAILSHGEIVLVAIADTDGFVYLVDLYRPLIGDYTLEVVGGGLEPGETPEDAARRELLEETGIEGRLISLGEHVLSTAMCPTRLHLFLAVATGFGEARPEPFERYVIRGLRRLTLDEAVEKVFRSEIRGLASVSLILKAAEYLRRQS
ncbi:MAG: NUDIX hydrolase [Chloroflexi bacterium]|nr:NUDIX hydrolase [Chloroflexota bacterium]